MKLCVSRITLVLRFHPLHFNPSIRRLIIYSLCLSSMWCFQKRFAPMQWHNPGFPRGVANLRGGTPIYYLAWHNFCRTLHETEHNSTEGASFLPPPWIRHCNFPRVIDGVLRDFSAFQDSSRSTQQ